MLKEKSNRPVKRYLFVGQLIERKKVNLIIEALYEARIDRDFILDIVGIGDQLDYLMKKVEKLGIGENVIFHGRKARESVFEMMKSADCFIMISSYEAFGLVYLEAMAAGCIVIATSDGSFSDIIVNAVNGYFANNHDHFQLKNIIEEMQIIGYAKRYELMYNALLTAKEYTDEKMACIYLDNIK